MEKANAPAMDFEQAWKLLPRLENEVVTTAGHRKRYQYRIVKVSDKGVLRQTVEPAAEEPGAGQREQLVSKTHFRRVWDRLASVGVCGMRMPHAGFVAACFIKLPELGIWYANTGKEWDSRNLLVLGNPADPKGFGKHGDRKPADWVSKHIVQEPSICGGQPTIRGTRIMVGVILGMYDGGYTIDKILEGFHWITREDVEAVLEFSRVEFEDGRAVVNS